MKEAIREFWDKQPCNSQRSTAKKGTLEYFQEIADWRYAVEPHILPFAQFGQARNKRVLEVGCGIGTDAVSFAKCGADVTAIDLSSQSLELARENAAVNNVKIAFIEDDIESLDASTLKHFDIIYAFGSLHHTPNPAKALQTLRACLHTVGELRLMLYSLVSYKAFWALQDTGQWNMGHLEDAYAQHSEAQPDCPLVRVYTLEGARALIEPPFTCTYLAKKHIFVWDIPSYKRGMLKKATAWQDVSDERIKQLEPELGQHILIKGRV